MRKFENKLLCTDIDGTLIDNNNSISEDNIKAIEYFCENGGKFTIASGRCVEAIEPILKQLKVDMPIVCLNGCAIYEPLKRKFLKLNTIDNSVSKIIDEIVNRFPESGFEIFSNDYIYIQKSSKIVEEHIKRENIKMVQYVSDYKTVLKPWIKILFGQNEEQTECIKDYYSNSPYNDYFKLIQTHPLYFEIFNLNSNKGTALKEICDMCCINYNDVFAIGDNDNDIEMIKFAKYSAAVGNACDTLKEYANIVVSDNNNSAIYDFVNKLDMMF